MSKPQLPFTRGPFTFKPAVIRSEYNFGVERSYAIPAPSSEDGYILTRNSVPVAVVIRWDDGLTVSKIREGCTSWTKVEIIRHLIPVSSLQAAADHVRMYFGKSGGPLSLG